MRSSEEPHHVPQVQVICGKGLLALAIEVVGVSLAGHALHQGLQNLIHLSLLHIRICDNITGASSLQ